MKPALTPEEWATLGSDGVGHPIVPSTIADVEYLDLEDRAKAAAVALHGQPFGFTWDDVDQLYDQDDMNALRSIADRIAALLPPREP